MTPPEDAPPPEAALPGSGAPPSETAPPPAAAGSEAAGPEAAGPEAAGPEAAGPEAAGPVANVVAAAVVVVLGAAAFAGALTLGMGSAAEPGPGLWPALVSAALVVLGLVLALRARRTDDAERFSRTSLLVIAAVATMAVFVAVIGVVGFEIPAAVLAFVWLRFLGRESWRMSIVVSLALTVVFYALFVGALDVTIPHLF
ncbi:tripartite tricarboxylate transporter TctB family protein [Cryptosporangium aurantiacum]|uniref:Tripartite tricarboxylate transporter TctB family protein n=1 Tax=Cryptosporangium aurantiacum TaxID=134849 RepID=A0A1M7Q481_9ACTN|nr:tripartite tricarboxylate transporter TctB family protein [Cryptosporangium aurantiacum]SHN25086.1 Tripartite tricarboxylate transporter TctB family protein [Cryptosporangium aurantiacum]